MVTEKVLTGEVVLEEVRTAARGAFLSLILGPFSCATIIQTVRHLLLMRKPWFLVFKYTVTVLISFKDLLTKTKVRSLPGAP
jgi:hypothetical protein